MTIKVAQEMPELPPTAKLPYEPPRLTRKKSVAKATLFSGSSTIVGGTTP